MVLALPEQPQVRHQAQLVRRLRLRTVATGLHALDLLDVAAHARPRALAPVRQRVAGADVEARALPHDRLEIEAVLVGDRHEFGDVWSWNGLVHGEATHIERGSNGGSQVQRRHSDPPDGSVRMLRALASAAQKQMGKPRVYAV